MVSYGEEVDSVRGRRSLTGVVDQGPNVSAVDLERALIGYVEPRLEHARIVAHARKQLVGEGPALLLWEGHGFGEQS